MSKTPISVSFDGGNGRTITLETGKLATQADGSAVVRVGDCVILATVVANKEKKPDQDFFPLSVDFQEKFASAGRIPGGFFRREGRLSDTEVLVSRLTDRVLRPLFPEDYQCDTQVIITVFSIDKNIPADSYAALAASAALSVSDIPFHGPISEVRVAKVDGKFIVNPLKEEIAKAELDIMVGASDTSIAMVEGEAKEVSEADLVEAIRTGHNAIKLHCKAQLELVSKVGKKTTREYDKPVGDEELKKTIDAEFGPKIKAIASLGVPKAQRKIEFGKIKDELKAKFTDEEKDKYKLAKKYYEALEYDVVRDLILNDKRRLDGRKLDEVRGIWMEVDCLPSPHGSAIFTRGETQSLTTVTLGSKLDELMLDRALEITYQNFILHYNFPAFSTGEVKPNRGPGRREVGHGNLALRALKAVIPGGDINPYTVRVVSDILESNGSSSMATVCAGSLALHDAGLKVTGHVSGIAMGLITDTTGKKVAILSDILGDEDHLGDMDFKVAGTRKGITACQMDIKVQGLSFEILTQALEQAKVGRLHIVELMYKAMPEPRADYKPHAPRMERILIPKEFIGAVIGPGGKIIQEMQRETNTVITIEEVGDQGEIFISSADKASIEKAMAKIKGITTMPVAGEVYEGTVKSIMPYGAFVEFLPGREGLLHISEVSHKRLETLDGVLTAGEKIQVKLLEVDKKTGKFKLSRKVLLDKPERPANTPAQNN